MKINEEIDLIKKKIDFTEKQMSQSRDPIDYLVDLDYLRWRLHELTAPRAKAVHNLRQNLAKVRQRKVEKGLARALHPRLNANGIDQRFLLIGGLLADWGFATRPLLIKYGCTDRDITEWKRDKLIVAGMEAYRPTPYAQTKVAVSYYCLTVKGQSYLKKHHLIWNGQLEQIYREAMKRMGKEPVFSTPKINAIAPQSFYFEHDIAALCCAIRFLLNDDTYQNMHLFGRALIKSRINHVLGLPIPNHKEAWQYDAILCKLPVSVEEIITNQRYYRYWEQPLKDELTQKIAKIDEDENDTFHQPHSYYFNENHYYHCLIQGISMEEDVRPIREKLSRRRQQAHQEYTDQVAKMEKSHPNRAMILEFERSKKKEKELDNFIVKMMAAVKSDATPVVVSSTETLGNNLISAFTKVSNLGWVYQWSRRTSFTEHGKKSGWAYKKITVDKKDIEKIKFMHAPPQFINDFAGFAFRKPK